MSTISPRRYEGSPEGFWTRYAVARAGARNRALAFDLDPLQYRALWGKPCHYCGSAITTIGLDRIDNAVGYTAENTVPCCWVCNSWKGTFTMDEFRAHLARLHAVWVQGAALPEDGYRTPPPPMAKGGPRRPGSKHK